MTYTALSSEYIEMTRRTFNADPNSIALDADLAVSRREIQRQRKMSTAQRNQWEREHFILMQELIGW